MMDIIEYNAGGRTRQLESLSRPEGLEEGNRIYYSPSGEIVVVCYYGRLPKFAWVGGRHVGGLVAATFVGIYWAVLLAVLSGRFRRSFILSQRK